MGLGILGIGTASPIYSIGQSEAAELTKTFCCRTEGQAQWLSTLHRRTHVQQRGSVLLEKSTGSGLKQSFFPPALSHDAGQGPTTRQRMDRYAKEAPLLAKAASRQALERSSIAAGRIRQLITVTCTGFSAPGFDVALIKNLGLPETVGRTQIGFMGCHGALNALRVAAAFSDADPQAKILVCSVELCSLHFHCGWHPEKIVANALFADGAGALVATSASQAPKECWRVIASGSCLFPDSEEAMTWRIGDYGFEMTLSARVPTLICQHLKPWLTRWLTGLGLSVSRIRSWAIHPGGPKILSTVAECLELSSEAIGASQEVLAQRGNMSSPTILFILEKLIREKARRPCVALGFGPGLVVEGALLL